MTDAHRPSGGTETDSVRAGGSSPNRFVLLAVLSFVVVLTVYILKTNLDIPKAANVDPGAVASVDVSPVDVMAAQAAEQIAHIQDVLARDSSNVSAWVALGNLYYDMNQPDEAIERYRVALSLRPDDVNVKTDWATMERAAGRPEKSIELLWDIVSSDSTASLAWFNMGVIYSFDLHDRRQAIAAWRRFLELNPQADQSANVLREIERLEAES